MNREIKPDKPFMTIRQVAKSGLISEHYLRLRLRQGRLPGFYSGTRFIVDFDALVNLLHAEALQGVSES